MPNYPFLLPHVTTRIVRILAEQHLTPEETVNTFVLRHKGKKHRYATRCTTQDGTQVIFYARLHANTDAREKMIQDIVMQQRIAKQPGGFRKHVPNVFRAQTTKSPEWYVREYAPTKTLGSSFHIERSLTAKDATTFAHFFSTLQRIPQTKRTQRRGADFFLDITEGNLKAASHLFSHTERQHIRKFVHGMYAYMQRATTHMIHGDCHPGNILFDSQHLWLIDWEIAHKNLRTMDCAFFYTCCGLQPAFRKKFLAEVTKKMPQKDTWKKEFPLSVTYTALTHIYRILHNDTDGITPALRRRVLQFAVRIVKSSVKGYTTIARL